MPPPCTTTTRPTMCVTTQNVQTDVTGIPTGAPPVVMTVVNRMHAETDGPTTRSRAHVSETALPAATQRPVTLAPM